MSRMLALCVVLLFSLLPLIRSSPSTNLAVSVTTPYGLVYDGQGHLYTSQSNLNNVVKISTSGAVVATFSFASTGFNTPRGLDIDAGGNLYVAEQFGPGNFGGWVKFDTNGNVLGSLTSQSQPFGVTVTPDGNTWVADAGENAALEYFQNGTFIQRTPTLIVYSPHGIASSSTGVVYIMSAPTALNNGMGFIIQRSLNGSYSQFASGFSYPEDLVVDFQGNVFVADTQGNRVVKLSSTGQVMNTFTPQDVPFNSVTGVAVDEFGTLYAADYQNGRIVAFPGATSAMATAGTSGNLCLIAYGLPGTVDYPWSSAINLNVQYNPTTVSTAFGPAVKVAAGTGTYTFTNKFGASTVTSVSVNPSATDDYIYLTASSPVDASGLTLTFTAGSRQLPGQGSSNLFPSIDVFNTSVAVLQGASASIDPQSEAFVSNIPGFVSKTIGASNINALAVSYTNCTAPVSFINGGRFPTQPSVSNGAVRNRYIYTLTDGATYTVTVNLTLTTNIAFATQADQLGNPFQTVIGITGTHTYTVIGGATTVSTVTGPVAGTTNRLFPYAFIVSSPGVYSMNTAPFLDATGLTFTISPATPTAQVTVAISTNVMTGVTELTESDLPTPPKPALTTQTFTLLP